MIKQLSHTCILTNDLKCTEHFYTEVLGLKKKFNFLRNNEIIGFYLDTGNSTYIEIVETKKILNQENSSLQHFCFEVEDIELAISNIKSKNWNIGEKYIGDDNTPHVLLKDPNGVQLELHQYTPKSAQINSVDVEVRW